MPQHTPSERAKNERRRRRPDQSAGQATTQRSDTARNLIQQQVARRIRRPSTTDGRGAPPSPEGVVTRQPPQPGGIRDRGPAPQPTSVQPQTEFDVLLNTVPGSERQAMELARVRAQQPEIERAVSPGLQTPVQPQPTAIDPSRIGPIGPAEQVGIESAALPQEGAVDVEMAEQEVMATVQQNPALLQRLQQLPPQSRAAALQNLLRNRLRVRQLSQLQVV